MIFSGSGFRGGSLSLHEKRPTPKIAKKETVCFNCNMNWVKKDTAKYNISARKEIARANSDFP